MNKDQSIRVIHLPKRVKPQWPSYSHSKVMPVYDRKHYINNSSSTDDAVQISSWKSNK